MTNFEPVAWIEHYAGSVAYSPTPNARLLPEGKYDLFTAAQMRQARIMALEEAFAACTNSDWYRNDALADIRALIEQESK